LLFGHDQNQKPLGLSVGLRCRKTKAARHGRPWSKNPGTISRKHLPKVIRLIAPRCERTKIDSHRYSRSSAEFYYAYSFWYSSLVFLKPRFSRTPTCDRQTDSIRHI